ncbi:MAG: TIGR03557 family F420-dependent LLM class oxidoreductase [Actinomycetota bacterium]|nr:TIGR03557 family F420-dependent LLM class oxidoreductase [Actinomycetota bacterium]
MPPTRYWTQLATEMFPPADLVHQAVESERWGFDATCLSDHFQPWWEPGESSQAWTVLGAIGQATEKLPLGTGFTTPVHRYHPAVTAQAFATLESMFPGRAFVGIGSGEALNETPCGMDWPPVGEQVDRMEEALEIISRLFDGERLDHDGPHFRTKRALLHTRGERRAPIYVSAFGPRAAKVAARWGDGLWTLADPEQAPDLIDVYRGACEDAGHEPGEIILQMGFSWAADDDTALAGSTVWKATLPPEYFRDDWSDPVEMQRKAQAEISDDEFKEGYIVSSDPSVHADRVREVESLGATVVCLQNGSGADPHGALRVYGEQVLPSLRGT